jgi:hypothetical protein
MGFLPTEYKCEKCGYVGKFFMEVREEELKKEKKLPKKK